jgi:excisionase family DNA binding protein
MIERPQISERERRRRAWQRAMSLHDFCERYGVGRTKAYEEIKQRRLKARKIGRRTIIAEEDAEEWLSNLPALHGELDEQAS